MSRHTDIGFADSPQAVASYLALVGVALDRDELADATGGSPPPPRRMGTTWTSCVERDELVVLHYLPSVLSDMEIAAALLVSVNTIKTQRASITGSSTWPAAGKQSIAPDVSVCCSWRPAVAPDRPSADLVPSPTAARVAGIISRETR